MDEIELFFNSLTATISIARGLHSLGKTTEINQKIAPLLEMILAMETNILSMKSFVHKLEEENEAYRKKLVEFENWAETDGQHELREVMPGIRVCIRKGLNDKEVQESVWYCANCWKDKIQSPLQLQNKNDYVISYFCPECKTPFKHVIPGPPPKPVPPGAWT